jgi:hypothetical protein
MQRYLGLVIQQALWLPENCRPQVIITGTHQSKMESLLWQVSIIWQIIVAADGGHIFILTCFSRPCMVLQARSLILLGATKKLGTR